MTEAKIITFAVVSALVILPLLEFLWNFIKSPFQILSERIEILEEEKSGQKSTNFKIRGHNVSGRWFGNEFVLDYSPVDISLGFIDYEESLMEFQLNNRVSLICPPNTLAKIKYSLMENMIFLIRRADTKGGIEIINSGIIDVPVNEFSEIEIKFKGFIDASKGIKRDSPESAVEIIILGWKKAEN